MKLKRTQTDIRIRIFSRLADKMKNTQYNRHKGIYEAVKQDFGLYEFSADRAKENATLVIERQIQNGETKT